MNAGRDSTIFLAAFLAGVAVVAGPLRAEETWDEKKREKGKKDAEEALAKWDASQPFRFKVKEDVYARTKRPKFSGPFYVYYPEHYGRGHVLQLHPFGT